MKIKYLFFCFLLLASCNKIAENSDEDDFIEGQEIEFIDPDIDERNPDDSGDTPKYQSEADNRIDVIQPVNGTVSDLMLNEGNCPTFRYGSYFVPRQEIKVSFIYANDNLRNITASDGVIRNVRKDTRNSKVWYFTLDSMRKNLEMIYLSFYLNNNTVVKGVRFLENHPIKGFYGTSKWGRMTELEALGLHSNITSPQQQITSNYIPKLGDVLYFGDREGVITKEYPKTKKGQFKFKITEMNAKCTGRKMTSSKLLFDVTKIVSGNRVDTATAFVR